MHLTPFEYLLIISTVLELNPLFQAIKSVQMKSAKEVSFLTFCSIMVIGSMWLYYGITIRSVPLIVGNTFKLISAFAVLVVYLKYRHQ